MQKNFICYHKYVSKYIWLEAVKFYVYNIFWLAQVGCYIYNWNHLERERDLWERNMTFNRYTVYGTELGKWKLFFCLLLILFFCILIWLPNFLISFVCFAAEQYLRMEHGSITEQRSSTFSLLDEDHTLANSVRFTLNQEWVLCKPWSASSRTLIVN